MGLPNTDIAKSTALKDLHEIRDRAKAPAGNLPARVLRLFGRASFPVDQYWYRAQFVIAAEAANDALKRNPDSVPRDQPSKDAWGNARLEATCLMVNVERALSVRTSRELEGFLAELEPSALILLAGVFTTNARRDTALSGDIKDERFHALEMAESKTVESDYLIAMVEGALTISPRAHYNLACYYSSKGRWLGSPKRSGGPAGTDEVQHSYYRSIEELELALTGLDNSMRTAAQKDPSLEGVSCNKDTRDKFKELVRVRTSS